MQASNTHFNQISMAGFQYLPTYSNGNQNVMMNQTSFKKNEIINKMMKMCKNIKTNDLNYENVISSITGHKSKQNNNKKVSIMQISKDEVNVKKNSRVPFTIEEDEKIKALVKEYGTRNWMMISFFIDGRTAKQCRDRYCNYLIPGIFKGEWSNEEDLYLTQLFQMNGPRWSLIHQYFPYRSPNSIKNRWQYFLSRKENNFQNEETITEQTKNEENTEIQNLENQIEFQNDINDEFINFFDNEDLFSSDEHIFEQ